MSSNFRGSLKVILDSKENKTKLFLTKLKHRRNLSTSIAIRVRNLSSKKMISKKEETDKKRPEKSCLLNINSISFEQISSYGTNNKSKIKKDTKEKDKEKSKNRDKDYSEKKLIISNDMENNNSNYKKRKKAKRIKIKSHKFFMPKTPNKYTGKKNEEKEEIIVRNKSRNANIPENFLILPFELNTQLQKPELNIISPNKNFEGNYSYYINSVSQSLKEFIEFDYDSIFAEKNKDNVSYYYYTTPMEIEDVQKKKLLLIDLDETLIHSEFRNKDNYKVLDLYTKNSKCYSKTFSYSDENCIFFIDVFFRPYLKDFLKDVSKFFDLAIFTAAMKCYADTIIDFIDPKNELFQFRLYRDACIPIQQKLYIKDLRIIKNYDPMNVILMDNSLYSFMNQPSNGMLVNSFYSDHKDTQLISAKNFLINHIYPCDDVRNECEKWYHFTSLFYKGTSKEVNKN